MASIPPHQQALHGNSNFTNATAQQLFQQQQRHLAGPGKQSSIGMSHPSLHAGSAMTPQKRAAEAGPGAKSKKKMKPADKTLPKKVEAHIPESRLYTELQQLEKRLDMIISRKKLDMMEQKNQLKPAKRKLRIFLSNLSADQFVDVNDLGNPEDIFNLDTMRTPSWTLRIEGRLLDYVNARKPQVNPPMFSTFVKSVIVELQRDKDLYPEGNVIEWHRTEGSPHCHGFEIKRKGDTNVKAKIMIYLDCKPEKFKLSQPLARLLDIHTDSLNHVVLALWQYVKLHKLQDSDDKRYINSDDSLRQILGQTRILFSQVPDLLRAHLAPPDPIVLEYEIRTDKEYHVSPVAWDVDVEVPNPMRERLEASLVVNPQILRDIGNCDTRISSIIQAINQTSLRRDFMNSFATDAIGFLNQWMASQTRDLETILGESRLNSEEVRRAGWWEQEGVREAIWLLGRGVGNS